MGCLLGLFLAHCGMPQYALVIEGKKQRGGMTLEECMNHRLTLELMDKATGRPVQLVECRRTR